MPIKSFKEFVSDNQNTQSEGVAPQQPSLAPRVQAPVSPTQGGIMSFKDFVGQSAPAPKMEAPEQQPQESAPANVDLRERNYDATGDGRVNRADILANKELLEAIRRTAQRDGEEVESDEELADYFISNGRWHDSTTAGMAGTLTALHDAKERGDEQAIRDMGLQLAFWNQKEDAIDKFQEWDIWGGLEALGGNIARAFTDPVNYAGGAGFAARAAGKTALTRGLGNYLASRPVMNRAVSGAAVGGAVSGGFNVAQQAAENEAEIREGYSAGEAATATAMGAGFGAAGSAAGPLMEKAAKAAGNKTLQAIYQGAAKADEWTANMTDDERVAWEWGRWLVKGQDERPDYSMYRVFDKDRNMVLETRDLNEAKRAEGSILKQEGNRAFILQGTKDKDGKFVPDEIGGSANSWLERQRRRWSEELGASRNSMNRLEKEGGDIGVDSDYSPMRMGYFSLGRQHAASSVIAEEGGFQLTLTKNGWDARNGSRGFYEIMNQNGPRFQEEFGRYMMFRRAVSIFENRPGYQENKSIGLLPPHIQVLKKNIAAAERVHGPKIGQMYDELNQYRRNHLELQREAGILNDEEFALLEKNDDYTTIVRILDYTDGQDFMPGGKPQTKTFRSGDERFDKLQKTWDKWDKARRNGDAQKAAKYEAEYDRMHQELLENPPQFMNPLRAMADNYQADTLRALQNHHNRGLVGFIQKLREKTPEYADSIVEEVPLKEIRGRFYSKETVIDTLRKQVDRADGIPGLEKDVFEDALLRMKEDPRIMDKLAFYAQDTIRRTNKDAENLHLWYDNGELKAFRVHDPELVASWSALQNGLNHNPGPVWDAVNMGRHVFQQSIVRSLNFIFHTSLFTDGTTAAGLDPKMRKATMTSLVGEGLNKLRKGFVMGDNNPYMRSARAAGVTWGLNENEFTPNLSGRVSRFMERHGATNPARGGLSEAQAGSLKGRLLRGAAKVGRGIDKGTGYLPRKMEQGVRAGSYKELRQQGLDHEEAAFQAMHNNIEFRDRGNARTWMGGTLEVVASSAPFLRAKINVLRRYFRSLNGVAYKTKGVSSEEQSLNRKRHMKMAAAYGVPMLAYTLYQLTQGDEDYMDMDESKFKRNLLIKINEDYGFNLRKTDDIAMVWNALGLAARDFLREDLSTPEKFNRAMGHMMETLMGNFRGADTGDTLSGYAPWGVGAAIDWWTNNEFGSGQIISDYMRENTSEVEWKQYEEGKTSNFARWVGESLEISPIMFEHFASSMLGGLYSEPIRWFDQSEDRNWRATHGEYAGVPVMERWIEDLNTPRKWTDYQTEMYEIGDRILNVVGPEKVDKSMYRFDQYAESRKDSVSTAEKKALRGLKPAYEAVQKVLKKERDSQQKWMANDGLSEEALRKNWQDSQRRINDVVKTFVHAANLQLMKAEESDK